MSGIARALQSADAQAQQPARDRDGSDLLNQRQVCREFGISYQTWIRWRKRGWTPEAVTLPSGRQKWRREAIDAMTRKPAPRISRYFITAVGKRRPEKVVPIHPDQSVTAEASTQPERLAK